MTATGVRRARRRPWEAACAGLAIALTGCATPDLLPELLIQNRPAAPVSPSADICDPDAPSGGVPDRFEPVAAYLCDPVLTLVPPDPQATPPELDFGPGAQTVPEESIPTTSGTESPASSGSAPRRFEGDLAPLLAALSVPDEPITNGVCALVMIYPPDVRLADADGRWVRPAIPMNACHQPMRDAIDEAFSALTPIG